MNKFTADQLFLKNANCRHIDIVRSLNYPQTAGYVKRAKDEITRLETAIADIKTRLNKTEIDECS